MASDDFTDVPVETDDEQHFHPVDFDFGLSRRQFVQVLGAGLLIAATADRSPAQQRRRGGGRGNVAPVPLAARLHIGEDGLVTVMTGKVECGQGARAQISQAAAEELRVPVERVRLIMADTSLVPDDGITAGSRTTPSTLPAIRQACATARGLLTDFAARSWNVAPVDVQFRDGVAVAGERTLGYADLAKAGHAAEAFRQAAPPDVRVTPVEQWQVLGTPTPRPNRRDLVTGAHAYPSDVIRPDMLYGKVLRPPSYGAKLTSIDLAPAKAMEGVVVVQDGSFVAVAAPSTWLAKRAILELEKSAQWETSPQPSSADLYDHLRKHAENRDPAKPRQAPGKPLKATYHVAYVQHAPLEPRAAVAEWEEGRLTVWTGTQNPFGVRRELANALRIGEQDVRVIVPDFGGGFGGKHTGETAVEAARLALAAKRPVAVRWTRAEEFTWAYFRPAAVIDVEATLDGQKLTSWRFLNINSGRPGIETPYVVPSPQTDYVPSKPPLRHGSYRALAATANNFAREVFMDELAEAAGMDPLALRLANLDEPRMKAVLELAAKEFGWSDARGRPARREPGVGAGIACGTEKGSFTAACAEVQVDRSAGTIQVLRYCQAFECGKITSPRNLRQQVEGCIVMGLGPALREVIAFEGGKIANASFWKYEVPRLRDLPALNIHLLDYPDLPPVGAGETPIIVVAPAIANAVYHACGVRLREMPLRLPAG